MRAVFWIGTVVLILGIASVIVPIPRNERHSVDAAGVSAGIEIRRDSRLSPYASAAMILAGAGAMVAAKVRRSRG